MRFIHGNTDLETVNYLSKSLSPQVVEKALNTNGNLVEEQHIKHDKTGEHLTMKWVDPNKEKPKPRQAVPATPFNKTKKLKHLREFKQGEELPEHLKDKQIPPAWRNLMISDDPDAEILAAGKDDQNRPHYLYHPKVVEANSQQKFRRIQDMMGKRQEIGKFIEELHGIDPDTSDCLNLIFHMGIRPGSTRDTKSKVEAIGATTLRGEHVVLDGSKMSLKFIGKKGVKQDHEVTNPALVKMLLERKEKAGDKGNLFNTSADNLRKALPTGIHPKDLRTMLATWSAQEFLKQQKPTEDPKEFNNLRNATGDFVSKILGNQRTMALKAYIDPLTFQQHSPKGYENWNAAQKEE